MSKLGMVVMLKQLSGNHNSVDSYHKSIGKTIKHIELSPPPNDSSKWDDEGQDTLKVTFDDGSMLTVFDAGQSCCESRYMRTDDKFEAFVGAKLLSMELKEAPTITGEWGDEHEVQFLELMTSKGALTMASHNEHNGYYGGFAIELRYKEST
jgi:hypothetical protein